MTYQHINNLTELHTRRQLTRTYSDACTSPGDKKRPASQDADGAQTRVTVRTIHLGLAVVETLHLFGRRNAAKEPGWKSSRSSLAVIASAGQLSQIRPAYNGALHLITSPHKSFNALSNVSAAPRRHRPFLFLGRISRLRVLHVVS